MCLFCYKSNLVQYQFYYTYLQLVNALKEKFTDLLYKQWIRNTYLFYKLINNGFWLEPKFLLIFYGTVALS